MKFYLLFNVSAMRDYLRDHPDFRRIYKRHFLGDFQRVRLDRAGLFAIDENRSRLWNSTKISRFQGWLVGKESWVRAFTENQIRQFIANNRGDWENDPPV